MTKTLYIRASGPLTQQKSQGYGTIGVIPFWEEIAASTRSAPGTAARAGLGRNGKVHARSGASALVDAEEKGIGSVIRSGRPLLFRTGTHGLQTRRDRGSIARLRLRVGERAPTSREAKIHRKTARRI